MIDATDETGITLIEVFGDLVVVLDVNAANGDAVQFVQRRVAFVAGEAPEGWLLPRVEA